MTEFARFIALIGVAGLVLLTSCRSLPQKTSEPAFQKQFGGFDYCEVQTVRQTDATSCGAACLSCVLNYWDKPVGEQALLGRFPLQGRRGYSLYSLEKMALAEGLEAIAVSMPATGQPADELARHIRSGRPIIIAVRCPVGRYFGQPLPVIESLDRRSFHPLRIGDVTKDHYLVICGVSETEWLVMDPCYGLGSVPRQSLLDWWRGGQWASLVCGPAEGAPGRSEAMAEAPQ
jgi:predicted double-glycine peptidase